MKIIIDIPEDMLEWFKNGEIIDEYDKSALKQVFKNGIPLYGMTNGEVIKEIYRHNSDMNCGSNGEYVHIWSNDGKCQMTIHKDFWNAPYEKGGEE